MSKELTSAKNLPARSITELRDALDEAEESGVVTSHEASSARAFLTLNQKSPDKCFYGTDKETNLFHAFTLGRSFPAIARDAGCPTEMIVLTALRHNWHLKAKLVLDGGDDSVIEELTRGLANHILEINLAAVQRDISDIYKGIKDPRASIFAAKSPQELQKILQIVMQSNQIKNALAGGTGTPPVAGVNVNIANVTNTQGTPQQQVRVEEGETLEALPEPSRIDLLNQIREDQEKHGFSVKKEK